LLPILKSHVKNTELSHFSGYFVPLSERLYQKVIDGETVKTKTMEVKILETVVEQIWALLPSYCDLPTDLEKVCMLVFLADSRLSINLLRNFWPMFCINKSIYGRLFVMLSPIWWRRTMGCYNKISMARV
jgi:hypothetical protein